MRGGIAAHALMDKVNSTPPERHRYVKDYDPNARKSLSIEAIEAECEKRGISMPKLLAMALTDEMRENAKESGMTMKEQAALIMKIRDKEVAAKKEVAVSGEIEIGVIEHRIVDPKG